MDLKPSMPSFSAIDGFDIVENLISKYLDMHGDNGDVLILISSSGNSKYVVIAYKKALKLKIQYKTTKRLSSKENKIYKLKLIPY